MNLIFQRGKLTDFWREEDIRFIKKIAGRHPALLRMTCAVLYDRRQTYRREDIEEYDALEAHIYRDASPICNQLWYGLADPELLGISRSVETYRASLNMSTHQKVLMDIAHNGESVEDHQYIFELEARGLIERVDGKWRIFAGALFLPLLALRCSLALKVSGRESASTVSRVFHSLESEYEQWKQRSLAERYTYAFADGTYFTVIYNGERCKMPILAVVGIAPTGEREVLAFRVGDWENQQAWEDLLDDLKARGVKEIDLWKLDQDMVCTYR